MTNISIAAKGASLTATIDGLLTSGMVGIPVAITYDAAWDGLIKTASFRVGNFVRSRDNIGATTTVPWEVMRYSGKPLEIGIEGKDADGNIVMPTVWVSVSSVFSGANSSIPGAPNPSSAGEGGTGTSIDDDSITTSTTWSSGKITDFIGDNCVFYTQQPTELTAEQKASARQNIGAGNVSLGDIPNFEGVQIYRYHEGTGEEIGVSLELEPYVDMGEGYRSAVLTFYGISNDEDTILRKISKPVQSDDAANKAYVDGITGDIETALDGILAIQNTLIGGDGA